MDSRLGVCLRARVLGEQSVAADVGDDTATDVTFGGTKADTDTRQMLKMIQKKLFIVVGCTLSTQKSAVRKMTSRRRTIDG